MSMRICVSTVTALLYQKRPDGLKWLTFTSPEKFPGKILFPGGKRTPILEGPIPFDDPLHTLHKEVAEEVGVIINEDSIITFGVATDPARDIRKVKLSKAMDGVCPQELANLEVLASFGCPDIIYIAEAIGEPKVDELEAKEAEWIDLRVAVNPDFFGAGHGVIALLLHRWYMNGGMHTHNSFLPTARELNDFKYARSIFGK
jgi:8-oxo-dGTP pyrophosphatase MutT (NUDIX family)